MHKLKSFNIRFDNHHKYSSRLFASKVNKYYKEKFMNNIIKNPLGTYTCYYKNQFNMKDNSEIIQYLIDDIKYSRLSSFILNRYPKTQLALQENLNNGIKLSTSQIVNPSDIIKFVTDYIEIMYELLKINDPKTFSKTYHTQFTKGLCN